MSFELEIILRDYLLARLEGHNWRDPTNREKLYCEVEHKLKRYRLQSDNWHARPPFEVFEVAIREIVSEFENDARTAQTFTELRQLTNLRTRHTDAQPESGHQASSRLLRRLRWLSQTILFGRQITNYIKFTRGKIAVRYETNEVASEALRKATTSQSKKSHLLLIFGLIAFSTLMSAFALFSSMKFSEEKCGSESSVCFDSGWIAVDNTQTTTYFYKHKLRSLPKTLFVWFSPDNQGLDAYLVFGSYPSVQNGNPITIQAKPDVIYLQVASNIPAHGTFDAATNQWKLYDKGFFRIIAAK